MLGFFFNSPAWLLISQSDWMTKLVLLALFALSVICGAIIAFKFVTIRYQRKQLSKLFYKIKGAHTFNDLIEIGKEFKHSLGGKFLIQNLNELKFLLEKSENQKLRIDQTEYLELLSAQIIDQLLMDAEIYLPILGTSGAVSPLIGLFGTVWGLIHAFVNISQEKSADIAVVAPGIAEALTTTLAGLVVAIPAMIAFHYFSNELRKMEQQLDHLSDRFLNIIKQTFIK
jgi:biopolymer transport protein TolQ